MLLLAVVVVVVVLELLVLVLSALVFSLLASPLSDLWRRRRSASSVTLLAGSTLLFVADEEVEDVDEVDESDVLMLLAVTRVTLGELDLDRLSEAVVAEAAGELSVSSSCCCCCCCRLALRLRLRLSVLLAVVLSDESRSSPARCLASTSMTTPPDETDSVVLLFSSLPSS